MTKNSMKNIFFLKDKKKLKKKLKRTVESRGKIRFLQLFKV